MQQYLASYADLQNHVIDLVFMLTSADEESCEKILELLISLDCVPDLLKTMFLKEDVGKKSINVEEHERNCWSIILKMAAADVSSKFRVASLALKLIKIIYQVSIIVFLTNFLHTVLMNVLHLHIQAFIINLS